MSDFIDDRQVVCVSHVDLDGHCAAAIVKRKYPNARIVYSNYGRDLPSYAYVKGSKMFVTDFSLTPMEFQKCQNLGIDVIWIDHHKSNIDKLHAQGINCPGIQDHNHCGAYLTQKFLFPNEPIPKIVEFVEDYDLWKKTNPDTDAVQCGMKMYETKAAFHNCFVWNNLFNENPEIADRQLKQIIELGRKILFFTTARNKILCKDLAYKCNFQGRNVLVANTKQTNSMFFDTADKSDVDALLAIQYGPDINKYRCSLYSPDNVKEVLPIAESLGGGGHPKACGFQSDLYPASVTYPLNEPRKMDEVIKELHDILELRKDADINQSACRSDNISLKSGMFDTTFMGKMTRGINHPYISELIRMLPTIDRMDTFTGNKYEILLGFCITSTGWHRCGAHFIDTLTAPDLEKFKTEVVKHIPDATDIVEENLGILGSVFWFYSKTIPCVLPNPSNPPLKVN